MKRCYYFQDTHPLKIFHFGGDNYYVSLRQLATCLRVNVNRVFQSVERKHITDFATLRRQYPSTRYTLHPLTLLIPVSSLRVFTSTFCDKGQTRLLHRFLQRCFLDDNKHLNKYFLFDQYESQIETTTTTTNVECVYGMFSPQKIKFFRYDNKTYYHATDVAAYIECTPSYCVNKFVDDENMVLWHTLKRYILNNFVCVNFKNYYKDNTIFLKPPGVTQLTMAVCGNNNLLQELEDKSSVVDAETSNRWRRYKRKKTLWTRGCSVGAIDGIDYIITANKNVYFKLRQITQEYGLRINSLEPYHKYLIRWDALKQTMDGACNVGWRGDLIMVESEGVYNMLCDVNLIQKANELIYTTVAELKNNFDGTC
uniref:Uncharacterized protein n=1 Tax=Erinnyis ello granulovirus TaxID=307444 RepID=A0A288WJ57_9BBAC|nr:hypothetical protein EREL_091 [Erinnyis ello granulovirus]